MSNLILCGLKGVGKTTFGKKLAKVLKKPFFDTDQMLEVRYEAPVRRLYELWGEKAFRLAEQEILNELQNMENGVIALGGGALQLSENREYLRKLGLLIYIHINQTTWVQRVENSPIFTTSLEEHYEVRTKIYQETAHIEISYGI